MQKRWKSEKWFYRFMDQKAEFSHFSVAFWSTFFVYVRCYRWCKIRVSKNEKTLSRFWKLVFFFLRTEITGTRLRIRVYFEFSKKYHRKPDISSDRIGPAIDPRNFQSVQGWSRLGRFGRFYLAEAPKQSWSSLILKNRRRKRWRI